MLLSFRYLIGILPTPPLCRLGTSAPRMQNAGRGKSSDTASLPQSPPSTNEAKSLATQACQPAGISPSSESSKLSGKRAAISAGRPVLRPSALARTGSKSTNQLLKIARAISSSVRFIRRFNSILSSSVPRMWAMARCSLRGGKGITAFPMSSGDTAGYAAPFSREMRYSVKD